MARLAPRRRGRLRRAGARRRRPEPAAARRSLALSLRLLFLPLLAAALLVPAASAAAPRTSVSVDRTAVATRLGHTFAIRSTIRNDGAGPATGLIAHLNVLSLGRGLYVDPEDWSSHRTRYLAPIPPGGSTTVTWRLSAVNAGDLGVYVAVVPGDGRPVEPATGPLVHVAVADRRTLDAGGVVPLALGVPALLAVAAVAVRLVRKS